MKLLMNVDLKIDHGRVLQQIVFSSKNVAFIEDLDGKEGEHSDVSIILGLTFRSVKNSRSGKTRCRSK